MKTHKGRYKLSWMADGSRRWRKKYKGKVYYFPLQVGETKESSYPRCIAEWKAKKAELDALAVSPWDVARERILKRIDRLRDGPDTPKTRESYYFLQAALAGLKWGQEQGIPDEYVEESLNTLVGPPNGERFPGYPIIIAPGPAPDPLTDGPPPWDSEPHLSQDAGTLGACVKRYLEKKQTQVSTGSYDRERRALDDLLSVVSEYAEASTVDHETVSRYREHLEARMGEGLAPATAQGYFGVFKRFVRYLVDFGYLENTPRNLDSKILAIRVETKAVEVWDADELREVLKSAPARTRLYLLLCLNCGMYPSDISDLRKDEVDLDAGTITRRRSKTRDRKTAPTVTYSIWQETLELLRSEASEDPERFLTNSKGLPLVRSSIRKDGKETKVNNVRTAFQRLMRDTVNESKPKGEKITSSLHQLRKTAATLLDGNKQYAPVVGYYLAHAPASVKERHYTQGPNELLRESLAWLRTELQIDKTLAKETVPCS